MPINDSELEGSNEAEVKFNAWFYDEDGLEEDSEDDDSDYDEDSLEEEDNNGLYVTYEQLMNLHSKESDQPHEKIKGKFDTFEKIEEKILTENTRPIRFSPMRKVRRESLALFLIKFFTCWNDEREVVYADNREIKSRVGRPKDLADIFMITRYYYPNVTIRQLNKLLYYLIPCKYIKQGFITERCPITNKRVWYYNANKPNIRNNMQFIDEYGNTYSYYSERV